ncbi:hypothetical protein V1264_021324 [Littorina saxatilis]|uniref:C3H1-type domain-containing protein n=1 Tax=Littorina saxatilis TaxID=31220 RepID=A0AAN9AI49_9CAEN
MDWSDSCMRPSPEEGKSSVNFFAEDGGNSSDDSDADAEQDCGEGEDNSDTTQHVPKLPNPFLQASSKLPAPLLQTGEEEAVSGGTCSVFGNPFRQAEQAKLGILEKHVPLTEAAPKKPASKQVCFKFKKGLCHLGAKCRFFHDRSNVPLGRYTDRSGAVDAEENSGQAFGRGDSGFQFQGGGGGGEGGEGQLYHPVAQFSRGQPADPRAFDEDDYMSSGKRKKRHGVTDELVPPKKALTDLHGHRKKERPWTTKK